jgi:hypothetical protein
MDIAGLDLYFVLKALSSTNFALDQLLNLLETIGSISIPLTFGMQIDANGVLSVEVDIFAGGTKIDGTSSIHAQLLGGESVRASRHTMSDDSGYVAIRAQGITEVDVTMTPTVEIGVDYSIFGVSVLDWSYNWQSPTGTGIGSHATYHSQEKTLNQLWDI